MRILTRVRPGVVARGVLLAIILFGLAAAPAVAAAPRLIRIIWDVGHGFVYVLTEPRTAIGADAFRVPKDGASALKEGFRLLNDGDQMLRKGDRVRMYVVNYNSVSHVWHESSTFEQVAETPSLVGPILNALVMAVTGVGKLPTGTLTFAQPITKIDTCSVPEPVATALATLKKTAKDLSAHADFIQDTAQDAGLNDAARRLAAVPTDPELWTVFDNQDAWKRISAISFEAIHGRLRDPVNALDVKVQDFNKATIAFDQAFNDHPMSSECRDDAGNVVLHRDNTVSIIKQVAGDGSPVREVVAKLQTANALWSTYERKLETTNWPAEAIEIVLKDAVAADVVLRVDAVFASPEKTVTERIQRSLVLGVEPFVPTLAITAGIAVNWFDFKTLRIEKAALTVDDALTIKDRLVIADADSWSQLAPVWLQHIKILRVKSAGLYGTFGTTPDRNIFKNIIYGGSIGVPRWRTVVTFGQIRATGYTEEDLTSIQQAFTDPEGFSSKDLTMTNLPLPKAPWHSTWFLSASFVLASF